jgi:hypothetical protein
MYFIGVAEILGALGIIFVNKINNRLPKFAVGGLMLVILGAIITHLTYDPAVYAIPTIIILILLFLILKKGFKSDTGL